MRDKEQVDHILRLVREGLPDRAISLLLDAPETRVQSIRLKERILKKAVVKPRGETAPPDPPPPRYKPNPVAESARWLGGRLREVKGRGFYLDGVPASTEAVVKAANRMRVNMGQDQLGPERWWVPVPPAAEEEP